MYIYIFAAVKVAKFVSKSLEHQTLGGGVYSCTNGILWCWCWCEERFRDSVEIASVY